MRVLRFIRRFEIATGAILFAALLSARLRAADPKFVIRPPSPMLEPAIWQGPEPTAQLAPSGPSIAPAQGDANSLRLAQLGPSPSGLPINAAPVPPQDLPATMAPAQAPATVVPVPPAPMLPDDSFAPPAGTGPLLDGNLPAEDLTPPVVVDENVEGCAHRGVEPYGGGHPTDWTWGCGGSPYRNGPGMCDDFKVGPRWHVSVDGMVMSRDETNLGALEAAMPNSFPLNGASGISGAPTTDQFDKGSGGRVAFMSQVGKCTGWDMQAVYKGIPEWHASIVYPILDLTPTVINPGGIVYPAPFPDGLQQRSLHYTSQMHSGEVNFMRYSNPSWRPFCGVRYIKFDDEIHDFYNQESQPPLPFAGGDVDNGDFVAVVDTDRLNIFDIQNDLTGFQIGLLHDTWRVNRRFAFEGFLNGGVYYNRVKYSNLQGIFTTQYVGDDTDTIEFDESRIDFSDAVINDAREYNEISYVAEASLTGVCRLNRCWALRAGYQAMWIANVHLASDAYVGNENISDDLFFHGWHAGIECRR